MSAFKNGLKKLGVRLFPSRHATGPDPYETLAGRYGRGVMLHGPSHFVEVQGITIGDWVYIGPGARMSGSGGLSIGTNVAIGPDVAIFTSNHRYEGVEWVPFGPELNKRAVCIEDHVWIAGRAVILPGVTIGEGAVVGAGAVVVKDVPPCAIVGGNPAVIVKLRDAAEFARLRDEQKLWVRELARQQGLGD